MSNIFIICVSIYISVIALCYKVYVQNTPYYLYLKLTTFTNLQVFLHTRFRSKQQDQKITFSTLSHSYRSGYLLLLPWNVFYSLCNLDCGPFLFRIFASFYNNVRRSYWYNFYQLCNFYQLIAIISLGLPIKQIGVLVPLALSTYSPVDALTIILLFPVCDLFIVPFTIRFRNFVVAWEKFVSVFWPMLQVRAYQQHPLRETKIK